MRRVSIADVAARAETSRTTVSHVVSGNRRVGEEVRRRVLAAMEELGYVPSRAAQSLKSGATNIIGLIVPDIGNQFFADLTKGVEQAALDAGYNMILGNTAFAGDRERFHLEAVRSRAVDGIVYAAGAPASAQATDRILAGIPFVLVDEEIPGASTSTVTSDNTAGGALVADHLLALGHRNAVILTASSQLMSSERRVAGFARQWTAAGGTHTTLDGGFSYDGGHARVREHADLFGPDGATAVFATNDLMALGAMTALRDLGRSVPRDISIVGYDDILAARLVEPALTSVRQDTDQLGSRAFEVLLTRIQDPDAPQVNLSLPVRLVERSSCATPQHGR